MLPLQTEQKSRCCCMKCVTLGIQFIDIEKVSQGCAIVGIHLEGLAYRRTRTLKIKLRKLLQTGFH